MGADPRFDRQPWDTLNRQLPRCDQARLSWCGAVLELSNALLAEKLRWFSSISVQRRRRDVGDADRRNSAGFDACRAVDLLSVASCRRPGFPSVPMGFPSSGSRLRVDFLRAGATLYEPALGSRTFAHRALAGALAGISNHVSFRDH